MLLVFVDDVSGHAANRESFSSLHWEGGVHSALVYHWSEVDFEMLGRDPTG